MSQSHPDNLPPDKTNPLSVALENRDRSTLEMVAQSVAHNQCVLAFQPVLLADGQQVGFYEGLIRIIDETGRIIPAKDFMPAVEKHTLGRDIDTLALDMGLRTLHENRSIKLSINMSARSIGYENWTSTLNRWLTHDGSLGERLILEITESSAMDQPEIVTTFMDRMSRHGICFALDDFGSGYTSLRYLKDFYFDILKIEGSFCHGLSTDPDLRALAGAMIGLGHHFEMLVIAEGVERAEDANALIDMGVDCLQGYFFDAPTIRPPWMDDKTSPLLTGLAK